MRINRRNKDVKNTLGRFHRCARIHCTHPPPRHAHWSSLQLNVNLCWALAGGVQVPASQPRTADLRGSGGM